eukprot:1103606-Prorocentrum_minimum.AAC.1
MGTSKTAAAAEPTPAAPSTPRSPLSESSSSSSLARGKVPGGGSGESKSGSQSRKGREHIPVTGADHARERRSASLAADAQGRSSKHFYFLRPQRGLGSDRAESGVRPSLYRPPGDPLVTPSRPPLDPMDRLRSRLGTPRSAPLRPPGAPGTLRKSASIIQLGWQCRVGGFGEYLRARGWVQPTF